MELRRCSAMETLLDFGMAVVVKTQETPGEHQNRWYMGVHPPQNGIGMVSFSKRL